MLPLCWALYLQDVVACRGCKQSDLIQLMEFDLPAGTEQEINRIQKKESKK